MSRAVKIRDMDGKQLVKKDEMATLRSTVIIHNPEESEIAKNLGIMEKGVFGMRFK
jgi:RNA polymerase subunit RPABC4/transcription elongation factor Spt4